MKGWIGVDLDGTLAEFHGETDEFHIGDPIVLMSNRVKKWLSEGKDVRIMTARVDGGEVARQAGVKIGIYNNVALVREKIQDWTEKHFGVRMLVTNCKDYGMVELWDDKAIQVICNTGLRADGNN